MERALPLSGRPELLRDPGNDDHSRQGLWSARQRYLAESGACQRSVRHLLLWRRESRWTTIRSRPRQWRSRRDRRSGQRCKGNGYPRADSARFLCSLPAGSRRDGSRSAAQDRSANDSGAGDGPDRKWRGARLGGGFSADTIFGEFVDDAVRRTTQRSIDVCRDRGLAARGRDFGLLIAGAAGNESRSAGGVAIRVTEGGERMHNLWQD